MAKFTVVYVACHEEDVIDISQQLQKYAAVQVITADEWKPEDAKRYLAKVTVDDWNDGADEDEMIDEEEVLVQIIAVFNGDHRDEEVL